MMITDDISEPGAWEREMAMRPRDVHPALREHAKEHAQLWQRVFKSEKENERLRADLNHFGQHDPACGVWYGARVCDCGYADAVREDR